MCGKIFIAMLLPIIFLSCKKDPSNDAQPGTTYSLLQDGPLSPILGKQINLEKFGNTRYFGNYWGANANELFISATQLLRLEFTTQKSEVVEKNGGIFTGKNNENTAVIFNGTINGILGYHTYNFNTGQIERILSLSKDQASAIHVGGDNMYVYIGILGPSLNPCTGIWDFWCSSGPRVISSSFYYLDRITKSPILLPDKEFVTFSKDGSKSVLMEKNTAEFLYIFNNVNKNIEDSINLYTTQSWSVMSRSICYDDVLKIAEVHGGGLLDQIVIRNAFTNQEMDRFTSGAKFLNDGVKWSADCTKLFYAGATGLNSDTMIINIYDLLKKEEKTIASFKLLPGGANPVSVKELTLSSDNKRILIKHQNDLYIKDLQ